jgi:hypothetical protein
MKKPTLNEWIAIAFAIISLIASICTALSDGSVSADEAAKIKADGAKVVDTVTEAVQD